MTAAAEIDWAEVRRRVEAAGRAVAGERELTPGAARAVLEARARALAVPLDDGEARPALELVCFAVGGETYGIEPEYVVEVARAAHLTPLPGARPPLRAVTAWRGELLLVHDLRARLGLAGDGGRGTGDSRQWLVVLGRGGAELAVLADEPREFREVPLDEVGPPPEGSASAVRGLTADAVVVLDGGALTRADGAPTPRPPPPKTPGGGGEQMPGWRGPAHG